ncbi:MAG TPA: trypsin-like peptidase domain-containing protein [Stellaceae bacterium]|nr:trypsin-like peptidase domain-containing protein [Stellaceae bacterium]
MRPVAGLALALLALAGGTALAADRRTPLDPNLPPWNAVAKVQTNIGEQCTGVLIAPATVLTAAHCIYNPRTRAFLQPVSLHVLFGYQRGAYRWHRLVTRVAIGRGFDIAKGPQPADWVRLDLAEPVPVTPLPLAHEIAVPGLAVALAGYNQDREQMLLGDTACQVTRTAALPGSADFIFHDCAGTHGTSGAPLLTRQAGGWAVIGINIAAGRQTNLALDARFEN